jgi:hypothetical protein
MRLVTALLAISLACATAFGADIGKERTTLRIKDNAMMRSGNPMVMRAIDLPWLAQPEKAKGDVVKTLIKVSEVGANAVCFDLPGLSADGAAFDHAAKVRFVGLMDEIVTRRMAGICRVFGDGAPKDADARKKAIETIAAALHNEKQALYWVTGPGNAELAAQLIAAAPALVVAADANAPVACVATLPANTADKCYLLTSGAVPPKEALGTVSFVLPDKEEMYAALDKALADPAESKLWTPDNAMLPEQEKKDGFVSLFNGKDLDGWWIIGRNKAGFAVNDGVIEWKGPDSGGLYTRDRYDNYILRLEWKINKNGNSGLYMRAPRCNRQSMTGMEIQLQGDSAIPAVTNQTTAAIYSVVAPSKNAAKPEGEWNAIEITLDGPNIKVVLNGETVQDTNLDRNEELKMRLRRGFIGLQDHASYVAFRNIRVKKL